MDSILIQESDFQRTRNKIRQAKEKQPDKEIIFSGNSDELNRKVLEKELIDILLINLSGRKDFMKQRDSGFNQVLAKLAKKKDIKIGINLDELLETKGIEKAKILARLRQNIRLAKKNKLKMKFISEKQRDKDDYDLKALGLVLGMPTWMTREL